MNTTSTIHSFFRFLIRISAVSLLLAFALGINYLSAWTGAPGNFPTCPPGTTGCDAAINSGSTGQIKTGGLTLGSLVVSNSGYITSKLGIGSGKTNPAYLIDLGGAAGVDGIRFPDGTVQTTAAAAVSGSQSGAGVQTTTSGTQANFLNIPAGVDEITLIFSDVSFTGGDSLLVQIGGSGGIETTGYASDGSRVNSTSGAETSTAGFVVSMSSGTRFFSGTMTLVRINGNTWVASHSGTIRTTTTAHGGGNKTIASTLDRIRITGTLGTAFDSGLVAYRY